MYMYIRLYICIFDVTNKVMFYLYSTLYNADNTKKLNWKLSIKFHQCEFSSQGTFSSTNDSVPFNMKVSIEECDSLLWQLYRP